MRLAAVIVAGGRSSRMGREKAFEEINGHSILSCIIERLRPQVDFLAINSNAQPGLFAPWGCPVIPDVFKAVGTPLAGLHAALEFAHLEGFEFLLTVPSDTPFLPPDLVERLSATGCDAAIATSGGQAHYLTGRWASVLRLDLASFLSAGISSRLQDWVAHCRAALVEWPVRHHDPFFNVNTPEDLLEARRIAAERFS